MLRINPFSDDAFRFYEEIVNTKKNTNSRPTYKTELASINETQVGLFASYDSAFNTRSLLALEPYGYNNDDSSNLKALYRYRDKRIQKLKELVTRHPVHTAHILNTCQNCTINEVDTFDHILPQATYPEFTIHPNNLFPCCSFCNRKKSKRIMDDADSALFLNLYLDELPDSQYLFVELGDNWMPNFYLQKPEDVSDEAFSVIANHYEALGLLQRFRESSFEEIAVLQTIIRQSPQLDVRAKTMEECESLKPLFGHNHRKIVLKTALVNSKGFVEESIG